MNKNNAKDYLPLVQALAEGKQLQYFSNNKWSDCSDEHCFPLRPDQYRIKPDPEVWYLVKNNGARDDFEAACVRRTKTEAESFLRMYAPKGTIVKLVEVPEDTKPYAA